MFGNPDCVKFKNYATSTAPHSGVYKKAGIWLLLWEVELKDTQHLPFHLTLLCLTSSQETSSLPASLCADSIFDSLFKGPNSPLFFH